MYRNLLRYRCMIGLTIWLDFALVWCLGKIWNLALPAHHCLSSERSLIQNWFSYYRCLLYVWMSLVLCNLFHYQQISLIDRVDKIYENTVWRDATDNGGFSGMGFVIKKILVHQEWTPVASNQVHYNMERNSWDVRNLLEVRSWYLGYVLQW